MLVICQIWIIFIGTGDRNNYIMEPITWKYCQDNSEVILASGIRLLLNSAKNDFSSETIEDYGNYLISDSSNKWKYIGEAKNLNSRMYQQSRTVSSTFYKNYKRAQKEFVNYAQGLKINDFSFRIISTGIGRKEVEEFGIVNIPTNLNKFQKGKRNKFKGRSEKRIWEIIQEKSEDLIEHGERSLMRIKLLPWFSANVKPGPGLYWVEHSKNGLIYIGESSDIKSRYDTHSGKTYFSALRRHIGESMLGFRLQTRKGKKRYFSSVEDFKVTKYLKECKIRPYRVKFGRFELEEHLIRKYHPILNRKENK